MYVVISFRLVQTDHLGTEEFMFYCEPCRVKQRWRTSIVISRGPCEMCDTLADCYDAPSGTLRDDIDDLPRDAPVLGTEPIVDPRCGRPKLGVNPCTCDVKLPSAAELAAQIAKPPTGDAGGHVDALAKLKALTCAEWRYRDEPSVIVETTPRGDSWVRRLFEIGFTNTYCPSDPPTWRRHETPKAHPDSLIYNPVTREFE